MKAFAFYFFLSLWAFGCAHSPPGMPGVPLKVVAAQSGRLVGAAVGVPELQEDKALQDLLVREFQVLATENALKLRDLQPKKEGVYDFSGADLLVKFARDHGMTVRGTPFAWHKGLPKWLKNGKFSGVELEAILHDFIKTTATHYRTLFPGVIRYWDVVNEAIGRDGHIRAESIWNAIGEKPGDYVPLTFRWAHEADPDLRLFYNDFSIEEVNAKSDAVYALLKGLLAQGVPVHGIGFQMHLEERDPYDFDSVSRNFDRFAALGLEIQVTEFDNRLDLRGPGAPTPRQLKAQARNYEAVARICVTKPACRMLVVWGATDRYDYVPAEQPGFGKGFLFDSDLRPKPAYETFRNGMLAR